VDVHRNKLVTLAHLAGHHRLQKVHKPLGVISCRKEKVDTVVHLLDIDGVLVRAVLQNRLLEVQKGPLVGHLLPHLHTGTPGVVGIALGAVGALLVVLCVFHLEALLHDGALANLGLHRDLYFYPSRMGFGPDEAGVDDAELVQAAQFLEAEGKQFARFGVRHHPRCRWAQPSVAVAAHVEDRFALDAARGVRLELYAVVAESARGLCAIDGSAAVRAENRRGVLRGGGEVERGVDLHCEERMGLLSSRSGGGCREDTASAVWGVSKFVLLVSRLGQISKHSHSPRVAAVFLYDDPYLITTCSALAGAAQHPCRDD